MLDLSYDLHIHSCLSPCADDDMTPANIIGMAAVKKLDVVALTDHNSCKNCEAFIEKAKEFDIIAIPGMELTTSEEVHVLVYFENLDNAMEFDSLVSEKLIKTKNNSAIFGNQILYNTQDKESGREEYLLSQATTISFNKVYDIAKKMGGVAVPAHYNKESNSVQAMLGFMPPGLGYSSIEIFDKGMPLNEEAKNYKQIKNSDAHFLEQISEPINFMKVNEKSIRDILSSL